MEFDIPMSHDLYEASKRGDFETLRKSGMQLEHYVTRARGTILHTYLFFSSDKEFVRKLLPEYPSLLRKRDADGDTPLHIAARKGYRDIVDEIVSMPGSVRDDPESGEASSINARDLMKMTNRKGNTALHEAARNNCVDVAKVLTEKEPDLEYGVNEDGESPIYLAAERGHHGVVLQILDNCKTVACDGPQGRTALHAAVLGDHNEKGSPMVVKILTKNKNLAFKADAKGWTPLHYAAFMGYNHAFEEIMNVDPFVVYSAENSTRMRALHLAACRGNYYGVHEIISQCPDSVVETDTKGWNVLHYVVAGKSDFLLKYLITSHKTLMQSLIEERDIKGNTPLHLLVASRPKEHLRKYAYLDARRIKICQDQFETSPKLKEEVAKWTEDVGEGPLGKITITEKGQWEYSMVEDFIPGFFKSKDSPLIVATLIATVTFAAVYTFPGGLKTDMQDQGRGTPILSRNAAFEAFIITNTIALILSSSSILTHFFLVLTGFSNKYDGLVLYCVFLVVFAEGSMVLAFLTGSYAMLAPHLGIAIPTCVLCSFFFVCLFTMGWEYRMFSKPKKTRG